MLSPKLISCYYGYFPSQPWEGGSPQLRSRTYKLFSWQYFLNTVSEPEKVVDTISNLLLLPIRKWRLADRVTCLHSQGWIHLTCSWQNLSPSTASQFLPSIPFTAKAERKVKSGLGKYLFPSCTYLIKWKEPTNYEIMKYWVEGSLERI